MSPLSWKSYGRYGTVGIELVLSIMVGYYVGHWIDGKYAGGHGWVTAFGSLVGVYTGFRALVQAAKYMTREAEKADADDRLARLQFREKALRDKTLRDAGFSAPGEEIGLPPPAEDDSKDGPGGDRDA